MLLTTGDYRLSTNHPILFNALAAAPVLLFTDIAIPPTDSAAWRTANLRKMDRKLKKVNGGRYSLRPFLFPARIAMMLLAAGFLFLLYQVIGRFFGVSLAAITIMIGAVEPTFLAHSRLVTTDVPAAMTIFATTLFLYLLYRHSTKRLHRGLLLAFGFFGFVSLISKYTAVIVAPFWVLLLVVYEYRRLSDRRRLSRAARSGGLGAAVVAVWLLLVTASYGFQFRTLEETYHDRHAQAEKERNRLQKISPVLATAFRELPVPFPYYVKGFIKVLKHSNRGHDAYLLGKVRRRGWWYYFPTAFVLKEPLPLVLGSLASAFLLLWLLVSGRLRPHPAYGILVAVPGYLLIVYLCSSLNLGIRHFLPLILFVVFMTSCAAAWCLRNGSRWVRAGLLLAYAGLVLLVVRVHPHYIAFFSVAIGSPVNGFKYLADSNADWGQDRVLRREYLEKHPTTTDEWGKIGSAGVTRLIISVDRLARPGARQKKKLKRLLRLVRSGAIEPVDQVGNTHLIFEISDFAESSNASGDRVYNSIAPGLYPDPVSHS